MMISAKKSALALLLAVASMALAQKPKSNAEVEAINAAIKATEPSARIAAVDNALTKFKDTEFKNMLLTMQVGAAADLNQPDKVIVYGENALKSDPKNYQVELWMAQATVQSTKEFDLDKDAKLKRAEQLSNDAVTNLGTAVKPNPNLTEEQWTGAKKQLESQAHEILGMSATLRKNWDGAIKEYQAALAIDPQPSTMARLAGAYNSAGKPADAAKAADQALAVPNVHPAIKQAAQAEKDKATKAMAK
jgi:tetratricopeptide (TPR) repeat protein